VTISTFRTLPDCEPSLRAHPDEHVLRVFVCVSCLLDMVVISM
jgi:hypothetical protein